MIGALPATVVRYRVEGGRTLAEEGAARAPGAGEVVVVVAGSALGAAPGAEVSGVVVAAGEAAGEWLARRVVVPRLLPCGECERCRRARVLQCRAPAPRGPVASCETVPARFLLSVEPPLWPADTPLAALALLADAVATPYAALVQAQVAPGDLVLVVGAGVRGRAAASLARGRGAQVAVIDGDPARRQAAEALGLVEVWDAAQPPEACLERLQALATEPAAAPAVRVIETTGSAAGRGRAAALAAMAPGSAVLLGDGDGQAVSAPLDALADGEGRLLGVRAAHPDLLPELAALVVRGEVPLGALCELLPFSAFAEALQARREGRLLRLPVLVPEY